MGLPLSGRSCHRKRASRPLPRSYPRDGGYLAFLQSTSGGAPWDLWVLPLSPPAKPFAYAASQFDEGAGAVSPDGRWMAYVTNETGAFQVVVQPFPDPSGGKWQISMNGGAHPRWRQDSRELYYVAPNGDLVAVSIAQGNTFSVGSSTVLFRTAVCVHRTASGDRSLRRTSRWPGLPDGGIARRP